MLRFLVIGVFLLISLESNVVTAYQDFSVRKLCPNSQLKLAFNQIYNNKPSIPLFNQSESAVLVHDIWTDENIHTFQDCTFVVDSNLYLANGRYGRGLFASVNTLNFRQDAQGNCVDYVRFRFDGSKTDKMCGRFMVDDPVGQQSFFNEGGGMIAVHIFVNKSVPFHPLQRSIEVNLVFTAYEKCNTDQSFVKCHPNSDDFCISSVFKNDDIQNCPPPTPSDEPQKLQQQQQQQQRNNLNQNQNRNQQTNYGHTKTTGGVPNNYAESSLLFFTAFVTFISLNFML
ncbi:uncharacterized protein LOC129577389 [Sitodiplosis mosellana]|uniref:uncharacterized protein LOC129577389 n=1 Tax=Sitodiplosis mosellana TaxID=263140 RepID=UPI002443B385|nr:uncharacterized protein LOC129577389 [Sitodiplosis mosellana]XP_055320305.1 uncharacterized protein LOC129577389 [Sitodiplosis mosellana]XP_055320307.1 uncharacterized protein LOC129577389 [Sitodiplosis mosellana]